MAILAKGDLLIGEFLLSKRAAALSPHYARIATNPEKMLWERVEAAKSADALAVGLAQPHRLGSASKRAGDALDEFCKRMRLRRECWSAGQGYCHEVRAEKAARGFHVIDQEPGEGEELTDDEIETKREEAIIAFRASNDVLVAIHPRCPWRMELLCYDRLPPSPYDDDLLMHGLLNLARHYGILDEGINRGKL